MSGTVTSMSMIKQVLQLHKGGSSNRLIAVKRGKLLKPPENALFRQ